LSSTQGTVASGGSSVVKANIDPSLVSGELKTSFVITDGVVDQIVSVTVNGTGGGSGDNPGTEPGNPGEMVVTNGLSAYYKFNNNYDDSVGEYDGFGVNDPTFVSGVSDEAVHFLKSKESSVQIPYGLICNKNFSISFWAKDLADGLIYYSKCSDNENRFALFMDNGRLRFICGRYDLAYQTDSEKYQFSHSSISDDTWHHIAIVSDYGATSSYTWTSVLYVDGKKTGTISEYTPNDGSETDFPNAFIVGGKTKLNNNYSPATPNFSMDNLRIYDNRQLTAAEVKEIFNAKQ
ncbi:MAG: LamG domain-containing protein, partial [Muribaculaceae bacterium]|nr:LamG domain-containing protein [Muribaculaceae bacterium]